MLLLLITDTNYYWEENEHLGTKVSLHTSDDHKSLKQSGFRQNDMIINTDNVGRMSNFLLGVRGVLTPLLKSNLLSHLNIIIISRLNLLIAAILVIWFLTYSLLSLSRQASVWLGMWFKNMTTDKPGSRYHCAVNEAISYQSYCQN